MAYLPRRIAVGDLPTRWRGVAARSIATGSSQIANASLRIKIANPVE
jgi:hypothetical protein